MKESIKNTIRKDLEILKEEVPDTETYNYIIKSILNIHTEKLSTAEVIKTLEKDIKDLATNEKFELWGVIYSLSTLIEGSCIALPILYYKEDFNNNEELKVEITGEIYDFILDTI